MKITFLVIWLSLVAFCTSCKKFLDAKPKRSITTVEKLADLQAAMDMYETFNGRVPSSPSYMSDEAYLQSNVWQSWPPYLRDLYIWNDDGYVEFYKAAFQPVGPANNALDELKRFPDEFDINGNNIKHNITGQALFHRSAAFYHAAQLWCKPYSPANASDLGIILRLTANIEEEVSKRATIQETYDRITADLKQAAELLPETSIAPTRPTKAAAFGFLSRVYLSMSDYTNAKKYADSCLKRKNVLLNYNSVSQLSPSPFDWRTNPEIIFLNWQFNFDYQPFLIDTILYKSYDNNDLRKIVYYRNVSGGYRFKGSYSEPYGPGYVFSGIATDEIYLTRAESAARMGDKDAALSDLNVLLQSRWKSGTFVPVTATDAADALNKILAERRKELVFRTTRWTDLRRFNLEGANITLARTINGNNHLLPPNDPRWVVLLPKSVIDLTGVPQNPR